MTFQEHQDKLTSAINSALELIPHLKTLKEIDEVQVLINRLIAMQGKRSTDTNSGIFAPLSSSQCIGEGIQ